MGCVSIAMYFANNGGQFPQTHPNTLGLLTLNAALQNAIFQNNSGTHVVVIAVQTAELLNPPRPSLRPAPTGQFQPTQLNMSLYNFSTLLLFDQPDGTVSPYWVWMNHGTVNNAPNDPQDVHIFPKLKPYRSYPNTYYLVVPVGNGTPRW